MGGESEQVRFVKPPIVNVALTVYFEPIASLQVTHLASLRQAWREAYPNAAELPPLRALNRGGDEGDLVPVTSAWPFPYVMFTSADDGQMIAIQNDRLVRSWTLEENVASYPGFENLLADLTARLDEFRALVQEETGQSLVLAASECSYVNRLPDMPAEEFLVGIATRWRGESNASGFPPSHYAGLRIHVDDQSTPGLRADLAADFDESPTLGLNARYRVQDGEDPALEMAGLHLAHDKVIEMFLEFTSRQMQDEWRREQ